MNRFYFCSYAYFKTQAQNQCILTYKLLLYNLLNAFRLFFEILKGNRQMTLLSDIKEELIMDGFMNNASGVFRCPTPDCNGQQFMNDPTKCERIICEQCNQTYGSMCLGRFKN